MMAFPQGTIESMMPAIQAHRDHFQKKFGRLPDPIKLSDFVYCHEDAAEAERMVRKHLSAYFMSVLRHYELMGNTFSGVKGYQSYAEAARQMQEAGKDAVLEKYIQSQIWGTPEQIVEKFRRRYQVSGGYQPTFSFSFGAIPFEKVRTSMQLFAQKVIPELRRIAPALATPA